MASIAFTQVSGALNPNESVHLEIDHRMKKKNLKKWHVTFNMAGERIRTVIIIIMIIMKSRVLKWNSQILRKTSQKFSLTVIAWYRNQAKKLAAREVTEWAWEKGHVSGVTWHVTRRAPMRAGAVLAARVTSSTDGQCTSQPSWDEREVRVGDGGTEVKKRRRGVYREVGDRESKGEQVRERESGLESSGMKEGRNKLKNRTCACQWLYNTCQQIIHSYNILSSWLHRGSHFCVLLTWPPRGSRDERHYFLQEMPQNDPLALFSWYVTYIDRRGAESGRQSDALVSKSIVPRGVVVGVGKERVSQGCNHASRATWQRQSGNTSAILLYLLAEQWRPPPVVETMHGCQWRSCWQKQHGS